MFSNDRIKFFDFHLVRHGSFIFCCGSSEGDFSMQGWVDDLRAAISHVVAETSPSGIWLVGNNTGGALALCVAADDHESLQLVGPNGHVGSATFVF